jgi:hypothetical protein
MTIQQYLIGILTIQFSNILTRTLMNMIQFSNILASISELMTIQQYLMLEFSNIFANIGIFYMYINILITIQQYINRNIDEYNTIWQYFNRNIIQFGNILASIFVDIFCNIEIFHIYINILMNMIQFGNILIGI